MKQARTWVAFVILLVMVLGVVAWIRRNIKFVGAVMLVAAAGLVCGAVSAAPAAAPPSGTCQKYGAEAFSAWTLGPCTQVGAHFAPDVSKPLPPTVLAEMWTNLQAQVGLYKSLGQFVPRTIEGHEAMVAGMTFADMGMVALFSCNAKDQIAGIRILDAADLHGLDWPAPASH
ncbi:MAG: hypothetical protein ACREPF_03535 [Rhodanobacteraceae bacterium]